MAGIKELVYLQKFTFTLYKLKSTSIKHSRPSDNMFRVFRTICHVLLQALLGCLFGHHLIMAIWVRTLFLFPMMIKDS